MELKHRSSPCIYWDMRVELLLVRVHATLVITPQIAVRVPAEDVGWKLILFHI